MPLAPEEPPVTAWTITTPSSLLTRVLATGPSAPGAPLVVAIDGRSAGGKTTLTEALRAAAAQQLGGDAVAVVHTDDLAWNEPFFGWQHLLRAVLEPLRAGEAVNFAPPAWPSNGRDGTIEVPAGLAVVLVEGVGSLQRATSDLVDVGLWLQSDLVVAEERGIARDVASGVNGDLAESTEFWHEWDSHERPFQEREKPWERAALIVWGTPDPAPVPGELAVADGPLVG